MAAYSLWFLTTASKVICITSSGMAKTTPAFLSKILLMNLTLRENCELLGTERDQLLHPKEEYDIVKIGLDGKTVWERP